MNKLFITGSTGFIGRHLLKELSNDKNNYCFCLVRDINNKYLINNDNIKYIESNPANDYSQYLVNCDYLVHLAAELDSKKSDIYKVNVDFTNTLIKQCNIKLKKVVFLSSITLKRRDQLPYQKSKKLAEELITSSKLPFLIIRPSWVLGKDSRSTINFINYLKKFPIVPIIGSGKTLLQPIYINDLTNLISQLIFNNSEVNKIIEVGGSMPVSYNEFINYFLNNLNIKKTKIHLPIWFCYFIANYSNLLSFDVISDFKNDTIIDNDEIIKNYNFQPLDYKQIIKMVS